MDNTEAATRVAELVAREQEAALQQGGTPLTELAAMTVVAVKLAQERGRGKKVRYMEMMKTFEAARATIGGENKINVAALDAGLQAVVKLCGAHGDWEA